MLVAFFHLLVLGVIALVSTIDVGAESFVELIVKKTGWVLLVLAVAHGITMIILTRLRNQWREQQLLAEAEPPDGPGRLHRRLPRCRRSSPPIARSTLRPRSGNDTTAVVARRPGGRM